MTGRHYRAPEPRGCQNHAVLRLDDYWIWDSWIADDGDLYHLFFLQAPRSLFAAPLVRQRDGSWAFVGFRNLEPKGGDGFHILDPIPVTVDAAGYVVAR